MKNRSPFAFILSLLSFSLISITANAQELRDAFRKVSQSVVIVRTKRVEISPSPNEPMTVVDGLGSGVLISNDGKILTAAHVVQTADVAVVEFADAVAAVCGSANHRTDADQVAHEWSGEPRLDEGLMQFLVGPLTEEFGAKATQQNIVRR